MITRDVHQLQVVPAFVHKAPFYACSIDGYTCTEGSGETSAIGDSGFMPGFIIDRLGLQRAYASLMIAPVAYGAVTACSTATKGVTYMALSIGLQHASASGRGGPRPPPAPQPARGAGGPSPAYRTRDWIVKGGFGGKTPPTSRGEFFSAEWAAKAPP